MKNLIIVYSLAIAAVSFTACNNNKSASTSTATDSTKTANAAGESAPSSKPATAVNGLVSSYLELKNALTQDNSTDAATAGKALADGFGKFDKSALSAAQKKSFEDIADDAHEMAEHIGESAGKLPHQREHFDMLSKDMYDLVKLLGAGRPLFVDHCPMYNDKKGAIWLSESKEIKNPYMGSGMSTCGNVKEELK